MDQFLETIKGFLGSLPGLITAGVMAVVILFLLVMLIVVLVKKHKCRVERDSFEAKYLKSKDEVEKDQDVILDLNEKVNTLTNDAAKAKKEYSTLEKSNATLMTDLEGVNSKLAAKEEEVAALNVALAECKKKKRAAAKKKLADGKPTVKKYSREELEGMTKHELMTLAKTAGYDGFYHKSKEEVVEHILESQDKKKTK